MGKILTPQFPEATEDDYIKIQGGMPKVTQEGGLQVVTHDYEKGGGMIVKSHIDHGNVVIDGKEFKVDLLKQFHGDPCESRSLAAGGEGYSRTK